MQTPLDVRYESPRTADLLLQIPRQDTRLCGFPSRPRQDSAEGSQDRHGRLERRKLMGCQRWVGGQMTPDQGGDVGRVLHAALSRSVPDGEPVSRPQTDRDPVQGGTAARWAGRQVGRLGIEQCTNSDQGQRRFRYLPLGGDRGEQAPRSKISAHFGSADTDLYIARITQRLWGGFRGIFGGTLP